MRIGDWSSNVCSSDLFRTDPGHGIARSRDSRPHPRCPRQAPPMARHRRRLRLSRAKERMIPMQIGCFRADGAGFVGRVQTRGFRVAEASEFIEYLYAFGTEHRVRWSEKSVVRERESA